MSIEWVGGRGQTYRTAQFDLARLATERHPDSPAAWYALAEFKSQDQDFAHVVVAAGRAIELGPPTAPQLRTYAKALIALGRAGDALAAVDRHAPAPAGPRLRAMRGEALRLMGRLAEARVEFESALAVEPREVTAGQGLSLMLTAQGAWQDLLDVVSGIEQRSALSMTLQVAKTRALTRLGRHAEARARLDFDRIGRVRTIPTPHGFASLAAFNAALVAELESPSNSRISDRPRLRLVGGTQIEDLTASGGPALRALFDVVRSAVEQYFMAAPTAAGLQAPSRAKLVPWALVLGPDDFQARHYHVEAALAGVYYVAAPVEIQDDAGVDGALVIPDLPTALEGDASLVRHIRPHPGRLVLFPGYLPHRTLPARRPGQRISIAFNAVSAD
jgi:hypothetical protein